MYKGPVMLISKWSKIKYGTATGAYEDDNEPIAGQYCPLMEVITDDEDSFEWWPPENIWPVD